jgi:hypothetical protein
MRDKPTPGAIVSRPMDLDLAADVHNALAQMVRTYGALLDVQHRRIQLLQAENAALRLRCDRIDQERVQSDVGSRKEPEPAGPKSF